MARVLVVASHPDDETIFAGGMIAKYASEGHDVYIVEVTRGEGGEVGDPPVGPKSELGRYREEEVRCAARALGAREVRFLAFVDPSIEIGEPAKPIDAELGALADPLLDIIDQIRPDVILTHGTSGEYGHPQHRFTLKAVQEALRKVSPWFPDEFLTWAANAGVNAEDRLTNKNDPADITLDVNPWVERKIAAMKCHRSQHALFYRNNKTEDFSKIVRRLEAFKRWERKELMAAEIRVESPEQSSDWRPPATGSETGANRSG
jgi:N-acetylglucosamine malate deacetylase 2